MTPASVLTVGEPLVCFAPELGAIDTYRRFLGGAEVNTAVGLARLGHRVQLLGAVGDDPHGDFVRSALEAEHVSTALLLRDPARPTGVLIKERPDSSDPWVRYARSGSAASAMGPEVLSVDAVVHQDLVHLTGVLLALGDGPGLLARSVVRTAFEAEIPVSFDINHRPKLIEARTLRARVIDILPMLSSVLCNEHEAKLMTGHADVDRALRALQELGPQAVVVKRGHRGASALIGSERIDVPAVAVPGRVDTVGAGDAFNAAWLHGRWSGNTEARALQLAAFAAARVVGDPTDHGGFPNADELSAVGATIGVGR